MFALKKFYLVISLLIFLPMAAMAQERASVFKCNGKYDVYDDTCYFPSGAFIFFNYTDGKREVLRNGSPYVFFVWNGGLPYRFYPKRPIWISF